jgi:hypothetical protein
MWSWQDGFRDLPVNAGAVVSIYEAIKCDQTPQNESLGQILVFATDLI